jgi:hypothetical protein
VPAFATNVFSRPDATGVRGGIKRKELSRAGDFPYDREVSYGQPAAYDRGSRKVVPFRFNPERSPWDDVEEAIGTPYLLSKDAPGMGSSIPGNGRGWASPPNLEPDELDTLENGEEGHLRQEGAYFRTMTLNEAKRKKKSKKKEEKVPTWLRPYPEEHPDKRFGYAESLDFSKPLGPFNLYARQGSTGAWSPALTGRSAWDPLMEFIESHSSRMEGSWADALGLLEGR